MPFGTSVDSARIGLSDAAAQRPACPFCENIHGNIWSNDSRSDLPSRRSAFARDVVPVVSFVASRYTPHHDRRQQRSLRPLHNSGHRTCRWVRLWRGLAALARRHCCKPNLGGGEPTRPVARWLSWVRLRPAPTQRQRMPGVWNEMSRIEVNLRTTPTS